MFAALLIPAAARPQDAPAAPRRVISLIPSVTDLIVAMGARDRLIGRTNFDTAAAVARLPSVGGSIDPNLERIVSLRPDLVFVWRETSYGLLAWRLAETGIRTQVIGTETLAELNDALRLLGRMLHVERAADSLRRAITDSLAAVRRSVAGRPRPTVMCLLGTNPIIVAGAGTFIADLIAAAGGTNVFGDVLVKWPPVNIETVLQRDPDVIVWPHHGTVADALRTLRRLPGWSRLRAVQAGRVVVVDRDLFDRPGPRLGEAARELSRGLFPDPKSGVSRRAPGGDRGR